MITSGDFSFIVTDKDIGKRIDLFLETKLAETGIEVTRSFLHKNWDNVIVSGTNKKKSHLLNCGEVISFTFPEPKKLELTPENIDLEIIHEDDDIIVINKPAGMVVHPSKGHDSGTVVHALLDRLDFDNSINGIVRPGIVHRLDKDTSGILIVAKNDRSMNKLVEKFKKREIKKIYYAIVKNAFRQQTGEIDKPIGRDRQHRKKFTITEKGKKSLTKYRVIVQNDSYALVKAQLITGRTHQMRVHFSSIGHPIVGDKIYSRNIKKITVENLMLCAKYISFYHPTTEKKMEFEVRIPCYFYTFLERIKLNFIEDLR